MRRLLWKFFRIIWLTLTASVAVIILMVKLLQAAPSERELEAARRAVVLDLAAKVLVQDGEAAATRFVRLSDGVAVRGLKLSRLEKDRACAGGNAAGARAVLKDGVCYRISLPPPAGFAFTSLAPVIPWLIVLISSAILAGALAQYLIRPVVHLRDGLSALAHGRFDVRIGDKMAGRKDEVTALAHDFDASAARLQELHTTQQRLFHDVSHELRSPLSRLQAAVGVLRQNPARLSVMLDRMDREVERLDGLVGEVLTLARLTAGAGLPLKTQSLDVVDLLNAILADAAFEGEAGEATITSRVEGAFLAEVDGELIYRALENVIRNALKHAAPHPRIAVSCAMSADLLRVCVRDQGPGVGQGELERIFRPFCRGDDAAGRAGHGLGLAIARQAVERHGGRVFAFLPAGGGLAVTLEIPRRAPKFLASGAAGAG